MNEVEENTQTKNKQKLRRVPEKGREPESEGKGET